MSDETICHPLMSGKGLGGLVLSGEVKGGEVVGEESLVDDIRGFLQHGGDVAEVFLGSTFTVEFEFADDKIFRWREGYREALDVDDPDILHRPAVERVPGDKIDISGRMKVSMSSITEKEEAAVCFQDHPFLRPVRVATAQGGELHFFRGRVEGGGDAELLRG